MVFYNFQIERLALIARNNKILVEKMTSIVKMEHLIGQRRAIDQKIKLFNRGHETTRKLKNDRIRQENLVSFYYCFIYCSKKVY
jgi:hypothetical protein